MYRISEVLNDTLHSRNLRLLVSTAGDILRLLTNVVDPLRKDGLLSHQLDPWVQDKLVHALHDELSAVLELTSQDQTDSDRSHSTQAVIFLARLLQFNLGFSGAWTEEMAGLGVSLCGLIFKLALVCRLASLAPCHPSLKTDCLGLWLRIISGFCCISCTHRHAVLFPGR